MSRSKTVAVFAFAALIGSVPLSFAQAAGADGSAGTSITGTSNGKQGAPAGNAMGRSSVTTSGKADTSMSNGKMKASGGAMTKSSGDAGMTKH